MTGSAVGQWESGATEAPDRDKVIALEDGFGCPDELVGLLGYAPRGSDVVDEPTADDRLRRVEFRLGRLESTLDRLEQSIDQVLRRLPGG